MSSKMVKIAFLRRCFPATARAFSTATDSTTGGDKIVASVLFERHPVIIPKMDPLVYAFREFSFRWNQQYRVELPEAFLKKSDSRGQGESTDIEFTPAPRITEADKTNDKKSLQRALDRSLYLLLYGSAYGSNGNPVWHFPEKVYESEQTLRKCAESALSSVIGDLTGTYFAGNAPIGHLIIPSSGKDDDNLSLKRFFFKSQITEKDKFDIGKCDDYVWVTKDEILEYFPEHAEYMGRMILD